jgi:adenylate cyclase class 2
VTLTYKGPRDLNPLLIDSGVKAREELEVTVSDADALTALFERLGYASAIVFEKNRETWQYRECVITVDELPQLGWYSEIEGPDAEAVQQVAAELALTADQHVEETYVELTARYGIPTPTGGRKLEF